MKKLLAIILPIIVIVSAGIFYYYKKPLISHTFQEANQTLQALQQGNKRFALGKSRQKNYREQIKEVEGGGQRPKAIVLSCMDSRSIPELIFDQGIGDIFAIRVAGNVINNDILGSLEYSTDAVGVKLIVVLGHTRCAAVNAACKGIKLGHLTGLLQQIQPAVQTVKAVMPKSHCKNPHLIDAIAKQNVLNIMKQIPQQSPIIAKLMREGKVKIVGGIYNIGNGEVLFFDAPQYSSAQVSFRA